MGAEEAFFRPTAVISPMADDTNPPPDPDEQPTTSLAPTDAGSLSSLLPHVYRGEISHATNAHNRMDQTTNWAITLLAVLLSVVFASPDIPAYLLLIGIIALATFLTHEVRRYRFFDHYRARVRLMQQHVVANMLTPPEIDHESWRETLGDDLRHPTYKVTTIEALSHRLHHIYGLLFAILGAAWVMKITAFTPETQWTDAAGLPGVPGPTVAIAMAAFYLALLALTWWPGDHRAMDEIRGTDSGAWRTKDRQ